ncbi:hypothetical protein [Klebsiella pneumoniae]|uniref:hypothetical protein n=1 Tax=Klebsiella pneumoniae TaxID=573 RepID=UPI001D1909EE|nr:hypothetical protein [Klebsiella pneumoniae]
MLDDIIRSYMYTQYNDDDNLRAFFTAYNSMAQGIYDWMVNANLPISSVTTTPEINSDGLPMAFMACCRR